MNDNKKEYLIEVDGRKGKVKSEDFENNLDQFIEELPQARITVTSPDGTEGSVPLSNYKNAISKGYSAVFATYPAQQGEPEQEKSQMLPSEPQALTRHFDMTNNEVVKQTMDNNGSQKIGDFAASIPQVPIIPGQSPLDYAEKVTAVADRIQQQEAEKQQQAAKEAALPQTLEEIDDKLKKIEFELKDKYDDRTGTMYSPESSDFMQIKLFNPKKNNYTPEQIKEKTALEQQRKALLLQKKFLDSIQEYQAYDQKGDQSRINRFLGGLAVKGDLQDFATLGISEITRDLEFASILGKAERGEKLTLDESKAIQLYQNLKEIESLDRGAFFNAGAGAQQSFELMRDMLLGGMGGGISTIGRLGIKEAIKSASKQFAKKSLETMYKTALMPSFYRNVAKGNVENYSIENVGTEDKPVWDVNMKDPMSKMLYKQWAQQYSEVLTENLGSAFESVGLLTHIAKKASKAGGIIGKGARLYDKIHNKAIHNNVSKYIVEGLDKMGLQSFPMEFIEEIANVPLQSMLLGKNQFKQLADPRFYQEVAISTAALSGVGGAVNVAAGGTSALIERRKSDKAIENYTQSIQDAIDNIDDVSHKAALSDLLSDLDKANYYDANGEFDGSQIMDDLSRVKYFEGDSQTYKDVESLVKEKLYREGQTQALKAIMEDEVGQIEYGTSGDVMAAKDKDDTFLFILGETDDTYLVSNPLTKQQKVISKADINQISAPVSVDRAVTDYFVTKATPAVTTPMPDISQVQQTQQEAQTETAQSQVPLQKGDKATYEGVSVTVDDVYTDNDGNTVAIITDDNNNSHNVPLESLSKMEPIVNKDRYILPDGRRAVIVGSDGDNIILDIIDDNNNIIDKIAAKADEISTFDKVPAEQANTIEGITSEQQAPPQEAQQPDEVQQQPQQSELPVDKDGNIDYDALLESDPERFIQEYSKVVEPQVVLEQLSEVVQEIDKEIQAKNKAIKKTTSFNKKASLSTDVSKLQKRRDSLTSQLLKLTQPQHESQKQIQSPVGGDIISQRWNNATKVRGNSDTRTLSDGSQLKGHWVLAEADAPTPSHDPHTLSPSEGFPTTSEGKNINDNDYTKKSAEVRIMAADYDGRAIDNPIFVKDGVVISGNNRTMSGLLAAENGTDSKYLQALQQRAQSLGFTAEQIASMKHPRVFFEVEDDVPMTTEMFAKFNQRETKSKTPTERAIVASKRDNSRLIGLILSEIDKHEKLSDVYQDANSSAAIVKYMTQTGLINSNEVPELFENGAFTANGKDFLESLLIGSIIKEDQIKILNTEGMKNIRSKIVKSIIPLAENYKLRKENQIIDDVNQAILYLYQAKAAKLTLGELIRQNDMFESKLFDEDAVFVALKLQQSEKDFRNFVEQVNARLSTDTANMFTGELETKQDIYGEFDQQLSDSERAVIEGARENNRLSQEFTLPSDGSGPITRRSEPDGVLKEPESEDAESIISLMEQYAVEAPVIEFSLKNWIEQFGLEGKISTPIGEVKIGDNQYVKIKNKGRESQWGMILPTLTNPDIVIEEESSAIEGQKTERGSSYIFVKTFIKDGQKIKYFTSVSVLKDGLEVIVSSHYIEKRALMSKIKNGRVLYMKNELLSNSSDRHLAENRNGLPDLLPTQENNSNSEGKVSKLASDIQQQSTQTVLEKAQNNAINNEIDSQAQQTNTSPSQAQKEAGNYKMGHVKVQGLNISIENPAGSTRSGVDANGQKWSVTMNNHYGYIRGTKGKDKDHIDVFLGKNQLSDKVYVIDQVNNDGSFDEHKVMIGFDSAQQARQAYLSNYSEGWNGLGNITEVSMREFKSWIDNGTRKVKPFAEYRSHSLDAIKQQAMEYSQKYGTSVEVVENAEDIKNPYARMAAQQYGLYGWYDVNSKKVYVYAPNIINNPSELEKTVLHEVVAHKGLRELLGEVAFNKLCDDVWNMMSQQDKIKWAAYAMQVAPSEVDLSQVEKGLKVKREAADEYMASFAEDGIKDQSVWQKIKQVVMDALRAMGINIQLSDADIAYMLYRSSQALKKNATIKEKAAAKKKSEQIENDLSDENIAKEKGFEEPLRLRRQKEENKINSLIGLHNISEQKLRKAIKQGGLANPSAAVIDMDKQSHDSYGEISLLMPKTLVDKKTGRNAGTFLADAWTPVYPGIRKQMSDKGSREYRKAIANLDTPLKNKIALYFQNYLDSTTVYDALFYWYALDRGLNPELVTKGLGDFTQQQIDSINALSEDGKSFWSLPEVSQQALIDAYKEKEGGVEAYNEKIKGIVEKLKANVGNLQGLRKKQVEQKIEDYEKYGVSIKSVADYYNNALRVIENFGKVDEYSTYYRAVKYVDDNNLRGDMDRWLSEKEKQFDVSEKLYAGTDNQGRQKWIPNTLENASRLMNRQGVAGALGSASFNHFIAMAAPKATSLKQIKTKQGNLSDEEQYEQFRQEWNDIYQDLALQLQPGASAWEDYGQWRLEEMLTVSNPKAFIKKEYGIELSDEFMSKFYDLVGAIKNDFPARYFETKFTRPVMLDEFAAAVVPDNVGDDIKEVLINAGLNVATYEHDNNDQRKELIKQLSDDSIRFRYKTLSGKNVNFAQLSLFDQPAEVSQDEVMLGRKLRPLQEGEFCHVERIFTKSKMFDFTAGERIESMDDVAYIFSQLEDASIENAFAVLVKDGKPYVIHIGMGDFSSSVMNIAAIVAADNLIKADSVYMVHNHPSGNIKCSRADIGMLQKFKKAFGDRAQDGIIINLKTGQYGIFTENGIEYRADKKSPESEFPIEIYSFNKQVFDYDYDPTRLAIINSSLNVAQFISGHRLGNRAKVNILILNNQNGVVGNILSERQLSTMKDDQVDAFASEIVDYTLKMGGVNAIVYGSDIDILDNGKQKLIEKISRSVRELSGQSINVIDWLYVEGNAQRYKSAMDEGVRFRYTQEMEIIKERAISDGTFMKAPNGNPSNLNEKQWLQVRSKAFKKWFGDWLLPLKSIKIINIDKTFTKDSEFLNYAKINFKEIKNGRESWKSYINKDTKDNITLSSDGINKSLSNKAKKASASKELHLNVLKYLPAILEESILGDVYKDKNNSPDIVEMQRYYGAVGIDGQIYRVKTTVKKINQDRKGLKNKYYTLEVQEIELIEERPGVQKIGDANSTNNPASSISSISATKLLKNCLNSKGKQLLNISKVVDENGEPMMVYHGSISEDIKSFDKDKIRANETDAYYNGFWFSTDPDTSPAWRAAKKVYPVFLNLRNPITREDAHKIAREYFKTDEFYDSLGNNGVRSAADAVRVKLQQLGYDGVFDFVYPTINVDEFKKNGYTTFKTSDGTKYIVLKESDGINVYEYNSYEDDHKGEFNTSVDTIEDLFDDAYFFGDETFVVFEPNQIKSATENVGDFSKDNDEIRFRYAPIFQSNAERAAFNESQLLFRRALDGEAITPDMIAADGLRKTMGEQSYQKMIDGIFNTLPLMDKAAIIKRGEDKEQAVAAIVDRICNNIPANRDALMETLITVKDALRENPLVVLPSDTDLLVQLWKETNLEPAMTIREKLANLDKANQIRFKIDDKNDKAPATNDVKLTRAQVWQERMVDRMVAVKVFYDELAKIGIKPSIDMNSYITENLAMSRAQTEDNHFKENIYRPMVEKVIEIEKLFIKIGLAKNDEQAYKLVNDYLYARHAPERNKNICCEEVMEKMMRSIDKIDAGFFKDGARNALMALASRIYNEKNNPSAPSTYKTFAKNIIKTKPDDPSHQQAFLQFQKKWEKLVEQAKTDMDNIFSSKSGTNRSGMTDAEAKEIMSKVYTDQTKQQLEELSDKVRQSTHFTIDTWEKYGLIDSQTGANMKKMYKYYIPLRSWEEKEDVDYDQLSNQAFNKASEIINLNRKARGRKSRADEPLVYIASLAQSAIVVGNKNMIRLNLFRLIKANDNNPALAQFASLPKVYYVETPESDTAVAYTERPAQELFDRGLVKTKTNKDYRWHKSHSEYDAHIVPVMVNGTRQMIELRGELGIKVASAINNTNVLHWQAANALKPMTNWLSAVRTSYNPEFVLTNFIRDFMFANMAYSVEGGNMLDLDKNLLKAFRSIHHLQRGKSVGDKWDAYYQEFLDNGGQTGFFAMRNIDKMKKDLETLHKQLQGGKMTVHKISQTAKNIAEYSNAMSESAMRLAVYITEREKGTSAKEAAYKAHEISVNFNRKGTWSGNFGGFYSFFNASVQGTARLGSLVWNNKGKAAAALAAISLAKLATAVIAAAVGGDDYDQLSDYVKFSNIVIPIGKDDNDKTRFLCIPMAQGVRAVTNIADNTVEVLTGNKTVWEASKTTLLNTVGEFVPLSFDAIDLTGRNTSYSIAAAIAPTAIQPWMDVWVNMDFKGDPIYKEPYMKSQEGFTPEYMNVYGNTNPILVGISKWLNDVAGGSDGRSASVWVDKNGKVKKSPFGYALDINPAKVEHLLNAYFGGLMSFPSNVIKTGYAMIDSETDVEIYNTPVVNRFIKKPYYQDGYADYFKVRDYVQTVKMTISAAKKAGDIEAAMNIQKRNTKLLMVYKSYEDRVKQLKELLNNDNLSAVNRDKLNKKMDEVILQASKDLNKIMTDEKDSRD